MPFLGELAALLTAALWSVSALVFAAASARAGSVQVNVTRLLLAVVYLAVLIPLLGADINLSGTQLLYLAISGVIGLTLGDTFLFRAFQEIGARLSMLMMSLAPAIAAVIAYVFLGESLSVAGVVGIAVTLAGIALVVLVENGGHGGSTAAPIARKVMDYHLLGKVPQPLPDLSDKEVEEHD